MSFEVYKVAVKIALVENVTAGLASLSRHFIATNKSAEKLQATLTSIGKMTLLGGGMVAAGGFGLKLLERPLEKAIEYERQIAILRQQGLGDKQLAEARKFADAQKIVGQSRLDMIRHFTEAQGAFRESGMDGEHALFAAKVMTPVLARYEAASEMLSGHSKAVAHQAMQNLNKTVEIMGGITDPKRAAQISDGVFKAVQSSGRMIDERQLKQFVAYGSSATNSIDMRTIFGGMEPIIGEFGGSTVATGLRTAFTRMSGAMAMPPKKMQGILSKLAIGQKDHGSVRLNDHLLNLMQHEPVAFAKEMMGVYQKNGISSVLDRERANAQLFGTNGAKIYNKIMSQMPTIEASLLAYDKARNPSEMLDTPEGKRLNALQDYQKKIEDLQLAIGQSGGVLDLLIKGLKVLNPLLESTAGWINKHPTVAKSLIGTFAIASALAVAAGGLVLFLSALRAVNAILQFTRFGMVLRGLMSGIGLGLRIAGQAVLFLGRALLMNPIGLLITGIAVAAFFLWRNWDSIKPKLLAAWEGIKNAALAVWDGVKNGFHSFVQSFLSGWQMLFNVLIEGINHVLPKSMELSRVTFADDYARANMPKSGDSPHMASGGGQTVQVHSEWKVDGRTLAEHVSTHQARALNRPLGSGMYDLGLGLPPVGMNYAK